MKLMTGIHITIKLACASLFLVLHTKFTTINQHLKPEKSVDRSLSNRMHYPTTYDDHKKARKQVFKHR